MLTDKFLRLSFLVLSGVLFSEAVFAQSAPLTIVTDQFDQYRRKTLQEKIFTHTDKNFYLAGEILWFKIYDVDGAYHRPLTLSKIAYLEVTDVNQKAVLQTKVPLANGSGYGSLYLPVSLTTGTYKIRAYSSWMKNFSPDYYFEKDITIVNSLQDKDIPAQQKQLAYDVQFFPEGGNLVAGSPGKVAFRAVDQQGKGIEFTGAVVNQSNDTIARFRPLKFGIGNFIFTPVSGDTYKAVIKIKDEQTFIAGLPPVNPAGYTMQVNEDVNSQLRIRIRSNISSGNEVFLFVHTRQDIKIANTVSLNNGIAEFIVNKNDLGDGISHFTIFNTDKQAVCERLYFKRPRQQLLIGAKPDQENYSSRKKVIIDISALSTSGISDTVDLSLSVYRSDTSMLQEEGNIFSYLWLNSDLKGVIESPEYYFSEAGPEVNEAVDNLMLTHGWRRFRWENILDKKNPAFEFSPEYVGHIITGKLTDVRTGAPAPSIFTYLAVPGKRTQVYVSKSDLGGKLKYYTKDFYGQNEVVLQTNTQIDSTYRIDIESPFSDKFSSSLSYQQKLSPRIKNFVLTQSIGMQVQNIYTGESIRKFYPPVLDSSAFYGRPNKTYLLDDYTRFTKMEEVLREYVKEISISRNRLRVISPPEIKNYFEEPPVVLMDGVPIFGGDMKIINYDPLKVKKIEIITNKYYYGPKVFHGIASFITYNGKLENFELDPHATVIDYEGLQLQREFFSPVYQTSDQLSSRLPDFRNLLYWSPNVQTDGNGKGQVSFYTSDQEGKYRGFAGDFPWWQTRNTSIYF